MRRSGGIKVSDDSFQVSLRNASGADVNVGRNSRTVYSATPAFWKGSSASAASNSVLFSDRERITPPLARFLRSGKEKAPFGVLPPQKIPVPRQGLFHFLKGAHVTDHDDKHGSSEPGWKMVEPAAPFVKGSGPPPTSPSPVSGFFFFYAFEADFPKTPCPE